MTTERENKKKRKVRKWKAWVSIGIDGNPIGIEWWPEYLQNNVRHIRVVVIPETDLRKSK